MTWDTGIINHTPQGHCLVPDIEALQLQALVEIMNHWSPSSLLNFCLALAWDWLSVRGQLWNHTKKRCWRRCCTTGTCSMIQSHSTHCNSWGYDLISLAVILWHHTAALRCRAAALRQPHGTLSCCRGCETVSLPCCTSSVIAAAQLCVILKTLDTEEGHCVQTKYSTVSCILYYCKLAYCAFLRLDLLLEGVSLTLWQLSIGLSLQEMNSAEI